MRSTEEILAKAHNNQGDPFGFSQDVLIGYLPFEQAKEFLADSSDSARQKWESVRKVLNRDSVLGTMREYMEFAWDKALSHRGLSASRSVIKMEAWVWLLGDDFPEAEYRNYGAPVLKALCEKYGFPIPDDPAAARMATSLPCRDDCEEGCAT